MIAEFHPLEPRCLLSLIGTPGPVGPEPFRLGELPVAGERQVFTDLNADGLDDLVVSSGRRLLACLNTGSGSFRVAHDLRLAGSVADFAAGRFTEDGRVGVASVGAWTPSGRATVQMLRVHAFDPALERFVLVDARRVVGGYPLAVVAANVRWDARDEAVVVMTPPGSRAPGGSYGGMQVFAVGISRNRLFDERPQVRTGAIDYPAATLPGVFVGLHAANISGDPRAELVLAARINETGSGAVTVLTPTTGFFGFSQAVALASAGSGVTAVTVGDADGDGAPDIIAAVRPVPTPTFDTQPPDAMPGPGLAASGHGVVVVPRAGGGWGAPIDTGVDLTTLTIAPGTRLESWSEADRFVSVRDVNGDGKADLLISREAAAALPSGPGLAPGSARCSSLFSLLSTPGGFVGSMVFSSNGAAAPGGGLLPPPTLATTARVNSAGVPIVVGWYAGQSSAPRRGTIPVSFFTHAQWAGVDAIPVGVPLVAGV